MMPGAVISCPLMPLSVSFGTVVLILPEFGKQAHLGHPGITFT
jgi:hypothetical protein